MLFRSGPRPGVVAFRDTVLFWTMNHGTNDLGIYAKRNIRGGSTPSLHAVGRAWDIGGVNANDPGNYGHELALRIIAASALCGVTEVIWNRHRWTEAGGTVDYHGVDAHTTHIHVGFTQAIADNPSPYADLCKWFGHALFGV